MFSRPTSARLLGSGVVVASVAIALVIATGAPAGAYTVRRGETLSEVAARFRVPVDELVAANGIADPDRILAGSRLRIPRASSTGADRAAARPTPTAHARLPARLRARPERVALIPRFDRWARAYGVPADLLKATSWLESGWQRDKVSATGAIGIGQLMPDTVAFVGGTLLRAPLDPHQPDDNIRMSARFLRYLLDHTGGERIALAAYYQGLRSVRLTGVRPATADYVDDVVALRARFR